MGRSFGGYVGDLGTLGGYIKYLSSVRTNITSQLEFIMQRYTNTPGWKDQSYEVIGAKLTEVKGKVLYLLKIIDETILYLKKIYTLMEKYLSIRY